MEPLKSDIATISYLTPGSSRSSSHSHITPGGYSPGLRTLVPSHDEDVEIRPFLPVPTTLERLYRIEGNVQGTMNLQSRTLKPYPTQDRSLSVSLFLAKWAEERGFLISLTPVPKMETLKFDELLKRALECHVPPDRAVWLIHSLVHRSQISMGYDGGQNVTDVLKKFVGDPLMLSDEAYFVKLSYEFYAKKLLDANDFLPCLIPRVSPHNMSVFFPHIMKMPQLFMSCFSGSEEQARKYRDALGDMLEVERVQLVQLGLTECGRFVDDLQTDETLDRMRKLRDLVRPVRLSIETTYRNILFDMAPLFDSKLLIEKLKPRAVELTDEEMDRFLFVMIGSLGWVKSGKAPLAALIADFMGSVLRNRVFPLGKFIEFLYENLEEIEMYGVLFAEMQFQKLFTYSSFLQYIHRRGYLTVRKEASLRLLQWLPTLERTPFVLGRVSNEIAKLSPDNEYEMAIQDIRNDVAGNIERFRALPLMYRYSIGMWLIDNATSFKDTCILLGDADLCALVPMLFMKLHPQKFGIRDGVYVEHSIPIFIARNHLKDLADMAIRGSSEIALALFPYVEQSKNSQSGTLLPFKSQLSEAQKNSKTNTIACDKIKSLFIKNSHLCSLHVYDAFREIRSEKDFLSVFNGFLSDLLSFEEVSSETLFNFFVEFCDSQSITSKPAFVFMESLIGCETVDAELSEPAKRVVTDFLVSVFRKRIMSPSDFLRCIFTSSLLQKRKAESRVETPIVKLFLDLLSERVDEFCAEPIYLTKGVIQGFARHETLHAGLLNCLRKFPTPIINRQLQDEIVVRGTNQGLPLGAAYYSLLPEELLDESFDNVFSYFTDHVDRVTSTFWTLWLQDRVYYKPGNPVTPATPDRQCIVEYMHKLGGAFSRLILGCEDIDCEKTMVYLNCWALLCENTHITPLVTQQLTEELRGGKKMSLRPIIVDYLHPVLFSANTTKEAFDNLCDGFLGKVFGQEMMTSFVRTAVSVFVMFVTKVKASNRANLSSDKIHSQIAKLFEWLPVLGSEDSEILTFVLDALNYIICCSASMSPSPIGPRLEGLYHAVPEYLRRYVLLDFPGPERPEPRFFFQSSEPIDQTMGSTSLETSIADTEGDDFGLFWFNDV